MSAAFDKHRVREYHDLLCKIASFIDKPSLAGMCMSARLGNHPVPYHDCGDPACIGVAVEAMLRSAGFMAEEPGQRPGLTPAPATAEERSPASLTLAHAPAEERGTSLTPAPASESQPIAMRLAMPVECLAINCKCIWRLRAGESIICECGAHIMRNMDGKVVRP